MAPRLSGLSTIAVAGATALCGVLMLGGVGPTAGGAVLIGEPLPTVSPSFDEVDDDGADDDDGNDDDGTTTSTSTTTTTTITTSTTSTSTTTSTTTTLPAPPPLPESVAASQQIVGAGGLVTFEGTCPAVDGAPLGPVVLWVVGDETREIATGMNAEVWSYTWTAPTDPAEFGSFTFQFWCGDPAGYDAGYPLDLQRVVDMVAVAPPTTLPLVESVPLSVIPATD